MKKIVSTLFVLLAAVSMANADEYLQASSTITQCPGMNRTVVKIDVTDAACGVAMKNNKITVGKVRPYLIVASPQVGREAGDLLGCFDSWLRVNGKDVGNSNVHLCQDAGSIPKDVIASQGIVPLAAGYALEVMMSADQPEERGFASKPSGRAANHWCLRLFSRWSSSEEALEAADPEEGSAPRFTDFPSARANTIAIPPSSSEDCSTAPHSRISTHLPMAVTSQK